MVARERLHFYVASGLTLEKRTTWITVKDLAERVGMNRMIFYSHYDEVSDVLVEFVDELSAQIMEDEDADGAVLGIENILLHAFDAMQDELEFYRLVASGVTSACLDWLAGKYGDLPLEELSRYFEPFSLIM